MKHLCWLVLSGAVLLTGSLPLIAQSGNCTFGCLKVEEIVVLPCHGNNCESTFVIEACRQGCNCGTCFTSGYGDCRGYHWSTLSIAQEPGTCNGCQGLAIHARTHSARRSSNTQHNAVRQGYTPGLIMLTPTKSYRPPLFMYAYNRCRHTYMLITEERQSTKIGGCSHAYTYNGAHDPAVRYRRVGRGAVRA